MGRPISFSATVRWPVELIGRNSVTPSITPRMTDCHHSNMRPFSHRSPIQTPQRSPLAAH